MFEALGHGITFIGTTVGGIPEIIISKDYGILSPPGDSDQLQRAILFSINQKWDRDRIKRYGMNFTWTQIARRTEEEYKKLLLKE